MRQTATQAEPVSARSFTLELQAFRDLQSRRYNEVASRLIESLALRLQIPIKCVRKVPSFPFQAIIEKPLTAAKETQFIVLASLLAACRVQLVANEIPQRLPFNEPCNPVSIGFLARPLLGNAADHGVILAKGIGQALLAEGLLPDRTAPEVRQAQALDLLATVRKVLSTRQGLPVTSKIEDGFVALIIHADLDDLCRPENLDFLKTIQVLSSDQRLRNRILIGFRPRENEILQAFKAEVKKFEPAAAPNIWGLEIDNELGQVTVRYWQDDLPWNERISAALEARTGYKLVVRPATIINYLSLKNATIVSPENPIRAHTLMSDPHSLSYLVKHFPAELPVSDCRFNGDLAQIKLGCGKPPAKYLEQVIDRLQRLSIPVAIVYSSEEEGIRLPCSSIAHVAAQSTPDGVSVRSVSEEHGEVVIDAFVAERAAGEAAGWHNELNEWLRPAKVTVTKTTPDKRMSEALARATPLYRKFLAAACNEHGQVIQPANLAWVLEHCLRAGRGTIPPASNSSRNSEALEKFTGGFSLDIAEARILEGFYTLDLDKSGVASLGLHVIDLSRLIDYGSAGEDYARRRAEKVVGEHQNAREIDFLLPPDFLMGSASCDAKQPRPVWSVVIKFDRQQKVLDWDIVRAIGTNERLYSFDDFNSLLNEASGSKLASDLKLFKTLAVKAADHFGLAIPMKGTLDAKTLELMLGDVINAAMKRNLDEAGVSCLGIRNSRRDFNSAPIALLGPGAHTNHHHPVLKRPCREYFSLINQYILSGVVTGQPIITPDILPGLVDTMNDGLKTLSARRAELGRMKQLVELRDLPGRVKKAEIMVSGSGDLTFSLPLKGRYRRSGPKAKKAGAPNAENQKVSGHIIVKASDVRTNGLALDPGSYLGKVLVTGIDALDLTLTGELIGLPNAINKNAHKK